MVTFSAFNEHRRSAKNSLMVLTARTYSFEEYTHEKGWFEGVLKIVMSRTFKTCLIKNFNS